MADIIQRRDFIKRVSLGTLAMGFATDSISTRNSFAATTDTSTVALTASKDHREAVYRSLKPFEKEVEKAIGKKQVIIKANIGQVKKEWWLNATDPECIKGILDFLKPIYKKKVIVAESCAAGAQSTMAGFENYNYMPILKEFDNVKFMDLNEQPAVTKWILGENKHPLPIEIISTYLDPDVYMISATRLKTHNCVFATLSLKNVVMGSPLNNIKQKIAEGRNQKSKMHSGGNRGLTYNMFQLASMGIKPDLAVLDGVVGMEGDGPVDGTPVEHGVALASTDWLAADRVGVELMGMDYREVKYLQWCSAAGMGIDNMENIRIVGPDYKKYIIPYKLHTNIEDQRAWVKEDYKS